MIERFEQKVRKDPKTGCWNWTASKASNGYGKFSVTRRVWRNAHRVSYELYVGPIPSGHFVCHLCDNRICVNPDHLFLGTPQDNVDDMVSKGRVIHGSRISSSKLKESQVLEILELLADGETQDSIARKYSVSRTSISQIVRGVAWNRVSQKATSPVTEVVE